MIRLVVASGGSLSLSCARAGTQYECDDASQADHRASRSTTACDVLVFVIASSVVGTIAARLHRVVRRRLEGVDISSSNVSLQSEAVRAVRWAHSSETALRFLLRLRSPDRQSVLLTKHNPKKNHLG